MTNLLKIDQEEFKNWHRKFTRNANCVLSTPLPFKLRKKRMTDRGYNRFAEIMNPKDERYKITTHDPLLTKDIEGAVPNAFGKVKNIRGRDYINISDIKGTTSKYQIDKFCNRQRFNLETKDITEDGKKVYVKDYNLLDPKYVMYTKSRRRKLVIGDEPFNKPKRHITPTTRRHNNRIDDIQGAKPKPRTWVRKLGDHSDDGSEFNTSLPLGSNRSKRHEDFISPNGAQTRVSSRIEGHNRRGLIEENVKTCHTPERKFALPPKMPVNSPSRLPQVPNTVQNSNTKPPSKYEI